MQVSVNVSLIINTFHYVSTVYFNQNLCKEQALLLVYTCVCVYIYIYTHTHTHTHTHTYIYI